jgi:peptidyl-prolyl cis-trans isomerase C
MTSTLVRSIVPLALAVGSFAGCSATRTKPGEPAPEAMPVLAEVEGESITLDDAERYFEGRHEGHLSLLAGKDELSRLVERLVDHRLLVHEGLTLGLEKDPEVVKILDAERLRLRRLALIEREVESKSKATDAEIEAFHARSGDRFEVRTILVGTQRDADEVKRRLAGGADFEDLARELSIGPFASIGGREPILSRERLDEATEQAIDRLQPGGVTPPISTRDGVLIVELVSRSTEPLAPLDAPEREKLRQILESRRRDVLAAGLEDQLLAEAKATVDSELLGDVATHGIAEGAVSDESAARVVARVGGEELKVRDLAESVQTLGEMEKSPSRRLAFLIRQVHEWMVEQSLRASVADDVLSPEDQRTLLDLRDALVDAKLRQDFVYDSGPPSDADVRAYYDSHPTEFERPLQIQLYHVFHHERAAAEESLKLLESGEAFEEVAKQRSEDAPTAARGGEVGWIRPGDMLVELEPTIRALQSGEHTAVVESSKGFHVLWARKRVEAEPIAFDDAKAFAAKQVGKKNRADALAAWIRKLRERADVVVHPEAIDRAVAILASRPKPAAAPAGDHGEPPPGGRQ